MRFQVLTLALLSVAMCACHPNFGDRKTGAADDTKAKVGETKDKTKPQATHTVTSLWAKKNAQDPSVKEAILKDTTSKRASLAAAELITNPDDDGTGPQNDVTVEAKDEPTIIVREFTFSLPQDGTFGVDADISMSSAVTESLEAMEHLPQLPMAEQIFAADGSEIPVTTFADSEIRAQLKAGAYKLRVSVEATVAGTVFLYPKFCAGQRTDLVEIPANCQQ